MAAKKKSAKAKTRKRSRAEPDRPAAAEPEIDVNVDADLPNPSADPRPDDADPHSLTSKQRAFAEALVGDPERCGWRAAWKAGYSGGNADLPLPETKRKRETLATSASRVLAVPHVRAYIDELEARAAAAFIASPAGAPVREHIAARETALADLEQLAAQNLGVLTAIALGDPRAVVKWGTGWVTVTDSSDLTYEQALLIKKVVHRQFGESGSETLVELADRAPYVKMLEQRVGKVAPVRHELSGPGGGPLDARLSVAVAPEGDQLDEVAWELLGVRPATVSGVEAGLSLDEIRTVLAGWHQDPDPHCTQPWELFEQDHWEESRARYLGDDG